jgi:hypothetical protein
VSPPSSWQKKSEREEKCALVIYSTLKMEAACFSEMSVHNTATQLHIPEDGILQLGI